MSLPCKECGWIDPQGAIEAALGRGRIAGLKEAERLSPYHGHGCAAIRRDFRGDEWLEENLCNCHLAKIRARIAELEKARAT